jgi:hypothetical protein
MSRKKAHKAQKEDLIMKRPSEFFLDSSFVLYVRFCG